MKTELLRFSSRVWALTCVSAVGRRSMRSEFWHLSAWTQQTFWVFSVPSWPRSFLYTAGRSWTWRTTLKTSACSWEEPFVSGSQFFWSLRSRSVLFAFCFLLAALLPRLWVIFVGGFQSKYLPPVFLSSNLSGRALKWRIYLRWETLISEKNEVVSFLVNKRHNTAGCLHALMLDWFPQTRRKGQNRTEQKVFPEETGQL